MWCEDCTDRDDLIAIVEHNVKNGLCFGNQENGSSGIGDAMVEFIEWFQRQELQKK